MSLKCSYIYEGKTYTRPEIIKKIQDENLHIKGNKMAAEKWLKEKLGDDQVIQWVSTLVDGRTFGQFQKDGTILLSELFEKGTEYHEAFHRVWQTFLSPKERKSILAELNNVNLDGVRKLYPKLGIEKLKEEYLAEAFREYVLNNGNILFPEKTQTFFQKLFDFLRKLFGQKPLDMKELFRKINEGEYRNAKVSYPVVITPMNRIADFDIDESSEIVRSISTVFLSKLFATDSQFQAFIKGRLPKTVLRDRLFALEKDSAFRNVLAELTSTNEAKALKMLDNHLAIQNEVAKYLKQFNIQIDEWEDAQDELGHKDSINDKPAFLMDDKSRFSQLVKLLLASIPQNTKSPKLGITVNSDWSSLSSKLAKKLSGKAISTTNLFRELDAMSNINPEFKTLLDILGGTNEKFYEEFVKHPAYVNVINGMKVEGKDPSDLHPMMERFNLRQAFHNAFTKHYYEFYVTGIKQDGTIYTFNSDIDAKEKAITNQFKNKIQSDWQRIEQWIKDNPESSIKTLFDAYKNWKYIGKKIFGKEDHLIDFNLSNPEGLVKGVAAKHYVANLGLYFERKNDGLREFEDDKDPFEAFYGQISSWLNNAAKAELETKVETELAISNIENNKVFPVNLHTFQTITLDSLNYYATMKEDMLQREIDDLLEEGVIVEDDIIQSEIDTEAYEYEFKSLMAKRALVIKARLPFLFNAYTQNSIWLNKILTTGEVPTLTIYDGLSPENDVDGKPLADVDPTDIFATFMAGLYSKEGELGLNVVYPAFKHSDRSVMYGYKMPTKAEGMGTREFIESDFVKAYKGYIQDQIGLRRAYESNKSLYKTVAHFNPHDKNLLPEVDEKGILSILKEQKQKLQDALEYNGNLFRLDDKPIGINKELWDATDKKKTYEQRLDDVLTYLVKESFIGFMEQTKLFTGDPGFYSSASNFFKRMNTQSSTGNPGTVDKVTNTIIDFMNQVTKVYHGVEYGKVHKKKADGKIREIIGREVGDYVSPVGDAIYNKYLEYGKKFNVENPEAYAQRFRDAYDSINENDGQSYANLFAWREFYTRIEGWNSALQKMFDIEMRIFNGQTSEIFDEIFNEWLPMYVEKYKPKMTLEQYRANPEKVIEEYWNKFLEPFRVIKGQYMGPVYVKNNSGSNVEGDEMSRVFIPGIRKTSYMPLIPSMIIGTNLEKLNKLMFDYGLDMFHMGSGAKVGTNSTIDIYDKEGNFILDKTYIESLDDNFNNQYGSELDYRFMKNQVKISGKEKKEIIMATQARKNMLQNFKNEDGTWVDEELAMEYIELHRQIVYRTLDKIDEVLDQDRKGFVQSIKKSLQDEPENVFNALEQLEEEGYIEQLPIRNKLENVLFSMVGKKGVKIKATGNAAIQAAVTMFESGSRKPIGDKLEASTELKTYLDADGNIQKAEIMLPLPQAWIPKLLKHYKTHDLFKAIEKLNSEIAEGKWENHVTFKGLRIPNQQVSSNDIFKVKKFFLPTVSNMVVVPADIVVKTGSDFDVDKMNLYMPNLDVNFEYIAPTGDISQMSMEQLQNRLIQVDGEILLHKDNFYQTLATIDDGLLKDEVYDDLTKKMDKSDYKFGPIVQNMKNFKDKKSMKFFDILNIPQQVQVKVNAVDSKIGVGVVATEITGHAMFQVNGVTVNTTIDKDGRTIETRVFSEGDDKYRLDSVYDTEGNLITENLSVILTSQVDAAKNDYAPRININKNTLPVLTYMIRRGESLKNTMMFLNQPIIHEYLKKLNVNNSLLYRALDKKQRGDIPGNNLRISGEKILEDVRKAVPNKIVEGVGYEENLVQNANQHEMLQRFLDIKAQGDVMLAYKQGSSADTDVPKNMNAYENVKESRRKADEAQLLIGADKVRTEGLLQPFFDVQRRFEELKKYYFMYNVPNFTELVNEVSKHIFKQDEKLKMLDILNSDFALYLIQNLPENKGKYEKLFLSPNNIGKRVIEAAKQYDNLFLKTLASKTKLSQQKNGKWKGIPAIQFIQPKDPFALNTMIEHFQAVELLDKELYEDLIMASLLQTSINPSPFSWLSVFPNQGYDIELFKKAFGKDNITANTLDFDNYLVAFFMNNPKFLPQEYAWKKLPEGSWFKNADRNMYRSYDRTTRQWTVHLNGKNMEPFGTYHLKNYQASKPLNKTTVTKPTAKNDNSRIILKKEGVFSVIPIQAADKKAIVKASVANKYIGFAEGIAGSSTEHYRKQAGKFANVGSYQEGDVVFVSIGGKRGDTTLRKAQQDKTLLEALKAISEGAILITDNRAYVDSSDYNEGEKRLAKNLESRGYVYSEKTVDGQLLGIWSNPNVSSDSRNNDKLFDTNLPKINIYAGTNENAELSNFAIRPFKLGDDITYPTVEHAFQLEKLQYAKGYTDEEISSVIERVNKGTASQAKAFGKTVKNLNVKEWDKDAYSIMKDLIRYSFSQNPKAKIALLNTGNSELTHIQDNSRWGKEFPMALMEVRKEFQMQEQDKSCTISKI